MLSIDGATLSMATDFGAKGYGTLEPGNGTMEEQISFTGLVNNTNGTVTLTGVSNVSFLYPYTETPGLAKTHAGSTEFIISNTSGFYNQFVAKSDDGTITETLIFTNPNYPRMDTATPPPTDNEQLATKKYVDDTAIAGSPKATNTVYGITKLSVAAVSPTDPIAVGDNDTRVPTAGEALALVGTSGTPGSGNKYVTNDDTATAATASKVARRLVGGNITVVTESPANNSTNAASTAYVDIATLIFKNGSTTKNAADSSATQTIAHGGGRIPKYVRIFAQFGNASAGTANSAQTVYNGTTQSSTSLQGLNSALSSAFRIGQGTGGTDYSEGVVTFDATNISIVWTKNNNPTGTYNLLWEYYG